MSITAAEYKEGKDAYEESLRERGKRCGPCYCGNGTSITPFHDQYFDQDFEPVGVVNCKRALRVGHTQQSMQVMVLASPGNEETMQAPAASTVGIKFMQADSEDGTYEEIGPSMCQTAPADGISADPCHMLAHFPVPDMSKPWLMVSLEFSGAITGGKCDCILNLAAR